MNWQPISEAPKDTVIDVWIDSVNQYTQDRIVGRITDVKIRGEVLIRENQNGTVEVVPLDGATHFMLIAPPGEQQPESKFEEAAAIRRGERDDDMPDYEVLTGWIQRLPMTWLPGLLVRVAAMCVHRGVYREGGIEAAIERAKALGSDPTSEVLRGENEQQPESVNQRLLDALKPLAAWPLYDDDVDGCPIAVRGVSGRILVSDVKRARAAIEAAKQATKGTGNANQ